MVPTIIEELFWNFDYFLGYDPKTKFAKVLQITWNFHTLNKGLMSLCLKSEFTESDILEFVNFCSYCFTKLLISV